MATGNVKTIHDAIRNAREVEPSSDYGRQTTGEATSGQRAEDKANFGCRPQVHWPFTILGAYGQKIAFLTAKGEFLEFRLAELSKPQNLCMLAADGKRRATEVLSDIAPGGNGRSDSFDSNAISMMIIDEAARMESFDPNMEFRRAGLWYCEEYGAIFHAGDVLFTSDGSLPVGSILNGRCYVRCSPLPQPKLAEEFAHCFKEVFKSFQKTRVWSNSLDPYVLIGWIGQAAMGAFPMWRTHLHLSGARGTGKSTTVRFLWKLMGGLSHAPAKNVTEAGHRVRANGYALAHIFDEQEASGEIGRSEGLVELARQASDRDGSLILRGSSDQAAKAFTVRGAFLSASIIRPDFTPADKSRWISIELKPPEMEMHCQFHQDDWQELEDLAGKLGVMLIGRVCEAAHQRWDGAFRYYRKIALREGCDNRVSDTLASIIAGWDILACASLDDDVYFDDLAAKIVRYLGSNADFALEENEGQEALSAIMAYRAPTGTQEPRTVAEIIMGVINGRIDLNEIDHSLQRMGLRLFRDHEKFGTALFVLTCPPRLPHS